MNYYLHQISFDCRQVDASVKFLHTYAYSIYVNVRIIVAGMTNQPTIEVAKYRFARISVRYDTILIFRNDCANHISLREFYVNT